MRATKKRRPLADPSLRYKGPSVSKYPSWPVRSWPFAINRNELGDHLGDRPTRQREKCRENKRQRDNLVGVRGFEPPTPCSRSRCATRLRYTPMGGLIGQPPRRTQGGICDLIEAPPACRLPSIIRIYAVDHENVNALANPPRQALVNNMSPPWGLGSQK
jgi:hypothetical protein